MTFPTDAGSECARAWEAMPWVLQTGSSHEQGEWLMNHLARCAACSAEFAQQSRLRDALSLPPDVAIDPEAGLKRLLARVDAADSAASPVRRRTRNWLPAAMAAMLLLQMLGMGVLGARLWTDGTAPYRTLSQAAPPAVPGAIRVVPDAGMKLADWDRLLHTLGLRVIDGPNDLGAYTVVPVGPASSPPETLRRLRANHAIRLAEPIDNPR